MSSNAKHGSKDLFPAF